MNNLTREPLIASGHIPMWPRNHPLRPTKPARTIPMAGDDNAAFRAWERACDLCRHSDDELGCTAYGVVQFSNGRWAGMFRWRGGCDRWWLRGIGA